MEQIIHVISVIDKDVPWLKFVLVAIFLLATVLVIVFMIAARAENKRRVSRKRHRVRKRDHEDERSYRNQIISSLSAEDKKDYSFLYERLDNLNSLIENDRRKLTAQKLDISNEINNRIQEAQRKIHSQWMYQEQKKDYYRCIALHYASFILADSIKREQEALRDAYVSAKAECDRLSREIDNIAKAIPSASGERNYYLKMQHKKLCETHHRCSEMKNIFGRRNTEYLELVIKQNNITGQYRDYIIHNCGKRGAEWGKRMQMRRLKQ